MHSKESLQQFIQDEFLRHGQTQDRLKATASFDDFATLMVSIANEMGYSLSTEEVKAFISQETEIMKNRVQEKADQAKAKMESLPASVRDQMQSARQAEANKIQAEIDDAVLNHWQKNRIVEIGIANLKGDDVLPLY